MLKANKLTQTWDYIIVGAGSAGCLLANRLIRAGFSVLLIEAGQKDKGFWLHLPVGYFKTIFDARHSRLFMVEPQAETGNRQLIWPRGRVLGGSSSINGLIYIRGQHADYDDWVRAGATGWGYEDVLPYFKASECYSGTDNYFHGKTGELGVSNLRNEDPSCDAWLTAAQEFGLPFNHDFNGETDYGVGKYQLSIKGRWRSSAAEAFLRPVETASKLTVLINTMVSKVIIENKQAIGIECINNGQTNRYYCHAEVILSGGALQSPQILQLSGIGPANLLRQHEVPIIHDSPEVGKNLQDHYQARTIVQLKNKVSLNNQVRNPWSLAKMGIDWLLMQQGPLTVGAGQVGGFAKTQYAKDSRADIQFNVMPLSVDKPGDPLHQYAGFTVSICQCRPQSRGELQIQSTNPFEQAKITSNYLTAEVDIKTLVAGLEMSREIYRQKSFCNLWEEEKLPGQWPLESFARNNGGTVFHPTSTCRMGSDSFAVLDPELRVNGINKLRVIDASAMPSVISANTNAATIMIAERGAALMLAKC